jgi:ribonuclease HI
MAARLMAASKKIFFDGGSRPAGMETAIVVGGRSIVTRDLGRGTSMDAEWRALIAAARCAHDLGLTDVLLLGDCAAVIAQANGTARCPSSCTAHLEAFRALPNPPGRLRIRYIRRAQNLAGIALARLHDR